MYSVLGSERAASFAFFPGMVGLLSWHGSPSFWVLAAAVLCKAECGLAGCLLEGHGDSINAKAPMHY